MWFPLRLRLALNLTPIWIEVIVNEWTIEQFWWYTTFFWFNWLLINLCLKVILFLCILAKWFLPLSNSFIRRFFLLKMLHLWLIVDLVQVIKRLLSFVKVNELTSPFLTKTLSDYFQLMTDLIACFKKRTIGKRKLTNTLRIFLGLS